jgi:hypothetical protein
MAAYVAFVKATFGASPDALADFGLKPRKARPPLTIDQMAAAAAKRTAIFASQILHALITPAPCFRRSSEIE